MAVRENDGYNTIPNKISQYDMIRSKTLRRIQQIYVATYTVYTSRPMVSISIKRTEILGIGIIVPELL